MKPIVVWTGISIAVIMVLSLVVVVYAEEIPFALPKYDEQWMNDRYIEMLTGSMQEPEDTPIRYQNFRCEDLKFLNQTNAGHDSLSDPQTLRLEWCVADPLTRGIQSVDDLDESIPANIAALKVE